MSTSDQAASPTPAQIFGATVNLSAVLIGTVLIIAAIKLSALLPNKYYFSLTKFIGGGAASPFIIPPSGLTEEQICDFAYRRKIKLDILCGSDTDTSQVTPSTSGDFKQTAQNQAEEGQSQKDIERERREESEKIAAIVSSETSKGQSILALVIRCLIPVVIGFFIGRAYGPAAFPAAGIGGGLAAFLLCWPIILLWDWLFISDDWDAKLNLFYGMYTVYVVLFYYLARFGAQMALYFKPAAVRPIEVNWGKVIESVAAMVIGGIAVKILEHLVLS